MEPVAKDRILKNVKSHLAIFHKKNLEKRLREFEGELTLENFSAKYEKLDLDTIFTMKYSWYTIRKGLDLAEDRLYPMEVIDKKGLRRLAQVDSPSWLKFLSKWFSNHESTFSLSDTDGKYLLMLYYTLLGDKPEHVNANVSWQQFFERVFASRELLAEIRYILNERRKQIGHISFKLANFEQVPLEVHSSYTRSQILGAVGKNSFTKSKTFREGVLYVEGQKLDILLNTINKTEERYSPTTMYEDYAISEEHFHWQSQSTTSDTSPTGERYINPPNNHHIWLFVREHNKKNNTGSDLAEQFTFLGPVKCVEHRGTKPISITWKLDYPIQGNFLNRIMTAVA